MVSQKLSQIQANKVYVLQKLRDARANLAVAYKDCKLLEIADEIINIEEIISDIEQNM